MATTPAISLDRIEHARSLIDAVFLDSPQFSSDALSSLVGAETVVKVECVNPVRSFKGRGAEYFTHVHSTTAPRPWVCASAGNFGQGLAFAVRKRDIPLIVFAASNASPFKLERMRALGADVQLVGDDFDAAKDAARQFAQRQGLTFIEDGRDLAITEGAGTLAIELLQWPDPFDAVLIPVGNGALINGVGAWLKEHAPRTLVIGAGAEGAPAMEQSFRKKMAVESVSVSTFADGVATRVPVPEAVAHMVELVDDVLLVDDDAIREAMRSIVRELGITVEPAGAVALACALTHQARFRDGRIAVVISGSNVAGG